MRRVIVGWLACVVALGVVAGCSSKSSSKDGSSKEASKKSDDDDDDKKERKKKKKDDDDDKDDEKKPAKKADKGETPSVAGSGVPSAAPVLQPPDLPSGRSAVPGVAEWASAKEITVKGSSALGCETKIIREWFRVSCRGANDTGGTPTGVVVKRGGNKGETFAFASGDVASLVFPWTEGTEIEAVFSWTDKSHKLVATWPKGSPEPAVKGVFEGASSPLDHPNAREPGDGVCDCDFKLNGTTFCEPYMWGANAAACETKYAGDCSKILGCAAGNAAYPP
jgi:hypothetical protein